MTYCEKEKKEIIFKTAMVPLYAGVGSSLKYTN